MTTHPLLWVCGHKDVTTPNEGPRNHTPPVAGVWYYISCLSLDNLHNSVPQPSCETHAPQYHPLHPCHTPAVADCMTQTTQAPNEQPPNNRTPCKSMNQWIQACIDPTIHMTGAGALNQASLHKKSSPQAALLGCKGPLDCLRGPPGVNL
ncbi:hypothetical protein BS47DRAFT_1368957 [Hydnum rufescens UP504]|uniref:Uncharacterized protein n=1 Tax=Hydnum rufescens UP504 TaxID=1448309 RepID=A0A9P6DMF2_9AGAM|nr:hypothetical protein BS47DRAFT_1368957 [Hydnum rufescens UP504]